MNSHLYLAGPMRGRHLYNLHAFAAAAWDLRKQGFEVFNPMERDLAMTYNPLEPQMELEDQDFDLTEAMTADLRFICSEECSGVALLPGWEESVGAQLEVKVAQICGKPILLVDGQQIFPKIATKMES